LTEQIKVFVSGRGQLGSELERTVPANVELVAADRDVLDITSATQVADYINDLKPQAIINAAAYTNVDGAESDKEAAWAVNATGIENLAQAAVKNRCYLLHISTDFVFDGTSSVPYLPDAPVAPLGVYGESKLAGEQALARIMKENWGIIRTAWVYSSVGKNFVKTMLRLAAEKERLTIIADQIGSPTWAKNLAETCWCALAERLQGVHHYTNDGVASWYDFAVAIQELGVEKRLLKKAIPTLPIPTEAYPTPAARPHFSVLDKRSLFQALPMAPRLHWRLALASMLDELIEE